MDPMGLLRLAVLQARDLQADARADLATASLRRACRFDRLARVFGAGSAWAQRRARRYACRARSLRTAGAR